MTKQARSHTSHDATTHHSTQVKQAARKDHCRNNQKQVPAKTMTKCQKTKRQTAKKTDNSHNNEATTHKRKHKPNGEKDRSRKMTCPRDENKYCTTKMKPRSTYVAKHTQEPRPSKRSATQVNNLNSKKNNEKLHQRPETNR